MTADLYTIVASQAAALVKQRGEDGADGAPRHPLWDASREERVAACACDLELFGRVYCPARFADQTPAFHRELLALAEQLETAPGRGAIIAAPRGSGKSTVLSFLLPLHRVVYARKRFIVLISDTHYQAALLVADLRQELEENPLLRADFGDLVGDEKWTSDQFVTANRVRVLARGTGSKLRGVRHREHRPDLIICDDLENDEHVQTPEQRTKAAEWFNRAVVPALNPRTGTLLVIGTVLHFDSLLVKLLALDDIYLTRRYAAIQPDGTPLWPERFPLEKLAQIKRQVGSLAFNSEYLNQPIDDAVQVFKPAWWQWYTRHDVGYDHDAKRWTFRGQPLALYQGVDPAISQNERADYFAHVTIGVTAGGQDVLVLEPLQDRLGFPAQVAAVIKQHRRWQPMRIGIEVTAYQRALQQQVLHERKLPIEAIGGRPEPGPEPAPPGVAGLPDEVAHAVRKLSYSRAAKEQRIVSRSVLAEGGRLWLREALPDEEGEPRLELDGRRVHHSCVAFYDQATQYPRSAHDDLLDALDNAIQCARAGAPLFADFF